MIRIGIYGYGNLGRGVEAAIANSKDLELVGVFTRRNPSTVTTITNANVYSALDVLDFKDKIDVLVLCGGSATDLPIQTPELAKNFNVVDSFDTHARIKDHYTNVNNSAKESGKLGIISVGWDPGFFSLIRLYSNAFLPNGADYTFWGKGVSQGHSDAIRRIEGVADAKQYTIPVDKALEEVRSGARPVLSTREKHIRDCYVVAKEGANKELIEKQIKEMPNYFADYDTFVHFITMEEFKEKHSGMPHGGYVFRTGETGLNNEYKDNIEFKLQLDSNPYFTGSILACFARACYKMNKDGFKGCATAYDVAPKYLIDADYIDVISHLL